MLRFPNAARLGCGLMLVFNTLQRNRTMDLSWDFPYPSRACRSGGNVVATSQPLAAGRPAHAAEGGNAADAALAAAIPLTVVEPTSNGSAATRSPSSGTVKNSAG
jgi:hypothetical protein